MSPALHHLMAWLLAGGMAVGACVGGADEGGRHASAPSPTAYCRKWGASNLAGTRGGLVTWGFVAAGTPGSARCGIFCPQRSADALPNFYPDPTRANERVPITLESLQPLFQAAFEIWSRAADIEFHYVGIDTSRRPFGDPAAGEPMIRIGAFAFGGIPAYFTAAASWAPPPNSGSLAGDILLNTNVGYQKAAVAESERLPDFPAGGGLYLHDLYLTALHEIGHAIGLGHSADCNAVMFGGTDSAALIPTFQRRDLSGEDAARLRLLYGPPGRAAAIPKR